MKRTNESKKYIIGAFFLALLVSVIIFGVQTIFTSAANTESPEKHYIRYEIHTGESLWSIAENYAADCGMEVREYIREVKSINNMTSDRIESGTHLIVICTNPIQECCSVK